MKGRINESLLTRLEDACKHIDLYRVSAGLETDQKHDVATSATNVCAIAL